MSRSNSNSDQPRVWAVRDRTRAAPQSMLARSMRRMPTDAEQKLWAHLHRLGMKGSHFRRQVRIGRYIVDFACHKERVVIEVDGGQHADNAADAARSRFIEERGYRVLRFWNNDVLGNIDGVLEVIANAIAANGSKERNPATDSSASPSPLAGEGRGGGSSDCASAVPHLTTPTPDPSPQGGGEQETTLVRGAVVRNVTTGKAPSPSPLEGEGRGGGSSDCVSAVPHLTTPTPDPSPQGGGEQEAVSRLRSPVARARSPISRARE